MKMRIRSPGYFQFAIFAFIILAFVSVTGALQQRVALQAADATGEGDIVRQVVYLLLLLVALAPLYPGILRRVRAGFPRPLLLLLTWCLLTLSWSPVPGIGLRRLAVTVIVAFCCLSLIQQVPVVAGLRRIWDALAVLVGMSLLTAIALPDLGIHQPGDPEAAVVGAWRGIFYHKNILGVALAFFGLLSFSASLNSSNAFGLGIKRRVSLACFGLALGMLFYSQSKTSLGITALCAALMLVLYSGRSRSKRIQLAIFALSTAVLVVGLVGAQAAGFDIGGLLNDPELFTGRGFIWQALVQVSVERPLTGLGYQSVFQVGNNSVLAGATDTSFYDTLAHAHNAYLEIYVSIGAIGLALAIWALVVVPLRAITSMEADYNCIKPFLAAALVFVLLHGFLESGLLDRDRGSWIVLLVLYGIALRARRDVRLRYYAVENEK